MSSIPPRDPNYSDVVLLMPMQGYDGSTTFDEFASNQTITVNGNVQIDTAQSKHGISSALFDGTGDYLVLPDSVVDLTSDFTVECWYRMRTDTGSQQTLFSNREVSGANNWGFIFSIDSSDKLSVVVYDGDSSEVVNTSGSTNITTGQWYHLALSYDGSTYRAYIDGVEEISVSGAAGANPPNNNLHIGTPANNPTTNYVDGWLEDIRITNGVARYVSGFTPPTLPLYVETPNDPDSANVELLLPFDGADGDTTTTDQSTSASTQTFFGNAQIDTSDSRFGGSSLLLDGTGDYVEASYNPDVQGSWTFECWINVDNLSGTRDIFSTRPDLGGSVQNRGISIAITSAGEILVFGWNSSGTYSQVITSGAGVGTNEWTHICVTYDGTNIRMFRNGTLVNTFSHTSTAWANTGLCFIGAVDAGGGRFFDGHIDDLRWTQGVARYTASFNPYAYPLYQDSSETFSIPAGTVSLTGYAPSFSSAVPPVTFAVPAGAINVTGHAPAFSSILGFSPPAGNIVVTGYAPVLTEVTGSGSGIVLKHQEGEEVLNMNVLRPGEMAINLTTGKIWAIGEDWTVYEMSGYYDGNDLPRSDPGVAGAFWNDDGTLKVSSG